MEKINKIGLLVLAVIVLATAVFAIPNSINIQGKLTSASGSSLSGTYNFTFRIYDAYEGGNKIYETNKTLTTDSRGIYDTILDGINFNFSMPYYLNVTVNNESLSPKINISSMPYAFRANISEELNPANIYTVNWLNVTTNQYVIGNITLGQKITFALGEILDNIIDGFLKITGSLSVNNVMNVSGTSGNIDTIGNITVGEQISANSNITIRSSGGSVVIKLG